MKHHKDWFLFRAKVLSWLFLPILRVVCCVLYLYALSSITFKKYSYLYPQLLFAFLKLDHVWGLIFYLVFLVCDSYKLQLVGLYVLFKLLVFRQCTTFFNHLFFSLENMIFFFFQNSCSRFSKLLEKLIRFISRSELCQNLQGGDRGAQCQQLSSCPDQNWKYPRRGPFVWKLMEERGT